MVQSGVLKTAWPTKMLMPNGGVNVPMLRFITKITPKCTGTTPIDFATRTSSGVRTRIDDAVSRNMPTASSSRLITSSTVQGGNFRLVTVSASACGTPFTVSSHENTPADATITNTCAVRYIEREAVRNTSAQLSSP